MRPLGLGESIRITPMTVRDSVVFSVGVLLALGRSAAWDQWQGIGPPRRGTAPFPWFYSAGPTSGA